MGASLAGAQGDGRDDLSHAVGKVQGLCSRLTPTSLSFRLQTMPRDGLGSPGQWSAAGIAIPVCRPLFLPGGARELMKRFVAQMSVNSGGVLSSLTFQAQPASGISQKKRRGRGKKTLYPPTHPLTHRPAEIPSPSGPWAGPELRPPALGKVGRGGPQSPAQTLEGEPGEYRGGWGGIWEGRGVSSPAPVGIAICSKFGVGSRGGAELASSQLSPLTPNQTSPAVSWVGMVRGSVRPEAAAVPAARALSCAREQTPEQRAVLGSEAVVNHLGCNANEAWPGAWS